MQYYPKGSYTATEIRCGLLQGSPISPMLFMLFISPLFKLDGLKISFGYADDIVVIETSPSLDENFAKIGASINKAFDWGIREGLTFDEKKSELLHFTRKRKDKDSNPSVITEKLRIDINQKLPYIKWLGVHFDRKLNFKEHVRIQTAKALKVVHTLRCLGNINRRVSPRLTKQAVVACALPIAHFGAETWWPGKTRSKGNEVVCNRVGSHLSMMDRVESSAARAILPVYRTTPKIALFRESGLLAAELTLNIISRRAAIRTRRLDPFHPLFLRA